MLVRKATSHDIEAMKILWKEFIDFHRSRDAFFTRSEEGHTRFGEFVQKNMDDRDWLVLVAEVDDGVCGYCMAAIQTYPPVYTNTRYGLVQDIAVTASHRRQGIGRELFRHACAWFKDHGVERIELEVAASNEVSVAFWERLGFREFIRKLTWDLRA